MPSVVDTGYKLVTLVSSSSLSCNAAQRSTAQDSVPPILLQCLHASHASHNPAAVWHSLSAITVTQLPTWQSMRVTTVVQLPTWQSLSVITLIQLPMWHCSKDQFARFAWNGDH